MIDLSIIIVNWNSTEYLLKCLGSIYARRCDATFEVIVVDNASPDNDIGILKDQYADVIIIQNETNVGFAAANNAGFRISKGEYVVFLNPDTELVNSAFDILLKQVSLLPSAGAVGCTLLNGDRSVQTSSIQTFPTILNQLLDLEVFRNHFPGCRLWNIAPLTIRGSQPSRVEVISGACILLRRDVFAKIGQFSEDYFMYAEDLDLCYKALRAGFINYYIPQAEILHHGGKSSVRGSAVVMKWRSILRYLTTHRGSTYQLAFRVVITCSAITRLAMIAVALMFSRGEYKAAAREASQKWPVILLTMLTRQNYSNQSVIPRMDKRRNPED